MCELTETKDLTKQNIAALRRVDLFEGFDFLHGGYAQHTFPRHVHEEYLVGVIESGVHDVWCRGQWWHASQHTVATFAPEETHYGGSGHDDGWQQSIFYFPRSLVAQVLDDDRSNAVATRSFDAPFQHAENVSKSLTWLRHLLESGAEKLLLEQAVFQVVERVFCQLSDQTKSSPPEAEGSLSQVREFIEDNISQSVDIASMAELSGLSKRQFIYRFQKQFQLAPYQYVMLARVRRAHAALKAGSSIVDAAAAAGFSDQSHLTRNYRAIYGVTPARYFSQ